jgi:hypothetical protein
MNYMMAVYAQQRKQKNAEKNALKRSRLAQEFDPADTNYR